MTGTRPPWRIVHNWDAAEVRGNGLPCRLHPTGGRQLTLDPGYTARHRASGREMRQAVHAGAAGLHRSPVVLPLGTSRRCSARRAPHDSADVSQERGFFDDFSDRASHPET